jgi:hypothetical protein
MTPSEQGVDASFVDEESIVLDEEVLKELSELRDDD